jgi:hypothetical protein
MVYGHFILSEGGCILIERKMRTAAFKSLYVLAAIASMAAWIWMFVRDESFTHGRRAPCRVRNFSDPDTEPLGHPNFAKLFCWLAISRGRTGQPCAWQTEKHTPLGACVDGLAPAVRSSIVLKFKASAKGNWAEDRGTLMERSDSIKAAEFYKNC